MKDKKKLLIVLVAVAVALIIAGLLAVVLSRPKQEEPALIQPSLLEEAVLNGRMAEQTLTFKMLGSTGDAQLDSIFAQLLDALELRSYWQVAEDGSQAGFSVNLSGNDVLTMDFVSDDDEVFLRSDLLANDTVTVAEDEAETVARKFIDLFEKNGTISRSDAEAFRELLNGEALAATPAQDIDFAAMIAGFIPDAQTTKEWEDWGKTIAERVEEVDPANQPEGSDPAEKAYKLTLTVDDAIEAYDRIFELLKANTEYMKLLNNIAAAAETTGEEFIDQMQQELARELPEIIISDIEMTYYANKEGKLVAYTSAFTMADRSYGVMCEMPVSMSYTRLTGDASTLHTVNYLATMFDKTYVDASLKLEVAEKNFDGELRVTDGEDTTVLLSAKAAWDRDNAAQHQEVNVTLDEQEDGETNASVAFYMVMDAVKENLDVTQTTDITLAVNGADVLSARAETQTGEPTARIDKTQAINLAQMSDDELETWVSGLEDNLQLWLITLVTSLPSSVLMMMMGVGM